MKIKNIVTVLLVAFVLASCTSVSKPIPIETSTSTSTILPTVTPMPTIAPTPTAPPAPTLTPQPDWITDFADPILAAIAGRKPDFQDDFGSPYGGWEKSQWCPDWKLKFAEGEMIVSDCGVSPDMGFTDFVIEMDARFLPGSPADPSSQWTFSYRQNGNYNYFFKFHYSGNVLVAYEKLGSPPSYTDLPGVLRPGQNANHVIIIVKDYAVALYVNNSPVYKSDLEPLRKNSGMGWGQEGCTVAYDNFKIWDISNIALEATSAP